MSTIEIDRYGLIDVRYAPTATNLARHIGMT
jgi:hypothetical protein